MPFGFFKKRKGKGRDDDLFDPTRDRLEADELELSGEFFDDGNYAAAPPPPPPAPRAYAAPPRPAAPV
ncbi:MAG: hypothetical protein IH621_15705, partial [Krumholzibacteria bacterium]|nr:hypothetical protein [Candidatus Krumholzibacteria bacterium]